MKIIEPQKKIDYFGVELTIDGRTNFVATDDDGEVYQYLIRPNFDKYMGVWGSNNPNEVVRLCAVDLDGMDWKETLMEVE